MVVMEQKKETNPHPAPPAGIAKKKPPERELRQPVHDSNVDGDSSVILFFPLSPPLSPPSIGGALVGSFLMM